MSVLVLAVLLLTAGCVTPQPAEPGMVWAWYFDTEAGSVFKHRLHTTGPFASFADCTDGVAYFESDHELMAAMADEVFSQCYPQAITQEELRRTSLKAP